MKKGIFLTKKSRARFLSAAFFVLFATIQVAVATENRIELARASKGQRNQKVMSLSEMGLVNQLVNGPSSLLDGTKQDRRVLKVHTAREKRFWPGMDSSS